MKNQHVELESEDPSVDQATIEDQAVEMPSFNASDSKPRSWIKRSLFLLSIIFFGSMCYLAYIQGFEAGHNSVSAVTQKTTNEAQPDKTKETSDTDDEDKTNKLPKPVVIGPKTPEEETKKPEEGNKQPVQESEKPEEVNKQPVEEDKKPADESNQPALMDNTKGEKYWKKFENNTELLIGISSVTKEFERRMLFRHYQIDPYSDYNITWRFFISNPSPEWEDMLKFENNTYGDIIILRNVEDTREVAREVKPFHFFLYVEKNMRKYQYVAKMDDDTFMNIPLFVEKYFNNETHVDKEYMGLLLQFGGMSCKLGQGWFYAFTWDLLLVINQKFLAGGRNYKEEDYQVGWYLCQSGIKYKNTGFDWAQCHDLKLERVWDDNKMSQPMTNQSICVHQLKRERHFVEVGQCATADGWNNTCIDQRYAIGWGGWDP